MYIRCTVHTRIRGLRAIVKTNILGPHSKQIKNINYLHLNWMMSSKSVKMVIEEIISWLQSRRVAKVTGGFSVGC